MLTGIRVPSLLERFRWWRAVLVTGALLSALGGCGGDGDGPASGPAPTLATSFAVAKATCATGDAQETGLQGQVPLASRVGGFKGFNCNLQQTSATPSSRGQGIFGQFALMHDKSGHTCGYTGGAFEDSPGTSVVDLTDPKNGVETTLLNTPAMLNPGESLKLNETRGLLVATHYANAVGTADTLHGFDVYDVGTDCRHPQLLASLTDISYPTAGIIDPSLTSPTAAPPSTKPIQGHEGEFAPDGLTYYVGDVPHGVYHAIDITDPTKPKYLAVFQSPSYGKGGGFQGGPHMPNLSSDGNRGYFVNVGLNLAAPGGMVPQTDEWHNGFNVVDTSEIQSRKPGGQIKFLKEVVIRDGAAEQLVLPVTIGGKKYAIAIGEAGTGQASATGMHSACAAGLTPFAMAQFFYMGDETNPTLINKIRLEVNDPKNCGQIDPDISALQASAGFLGGFLYDVHMCSVDNRDDATTLACGYFKSGIRVYDIRDPRNIKEIAYFVPPANSDTPKWCAALPFLEAKSGMLYSWCADAGVLALKFGNGVWPFSNSTTPVDKQL